MTRLFEHHASLEMLGLWFVEVVFCFALGYALLRVEAASGGAVALPAAEAGVLALTGGAISFVIGMYRPETFLQLRRIVAKTAVGGVLSFPAIWVVGHYGLGLDFGLLLGHGALLPLKVLTAWILLVLMIRMAFSYSLRMNLFMRRIVILGGSGGAAARTRAAIERLGCGLFETVGLMPSAQSLPGGLPADGPGQVVEQLRRHRVWALVVAAGANGAGLSEMLQQCKAGGIRVWRDADFWERQLRRVDIEQIDPDWSVFASRSSAELGQDVVRRAADIVLSVALLMATLPLMLVTALLIRLDSPGSVLYRQERVGLHGRVFTLYKFRSMRTDAECGGPVWAAQQDDRVTRVGQFIRRTRIDELPQLINVLRGEMSFIGPRPERPHFVERLAAQIPLYRDRTCVKPGLTGWAQVNYPYGASVEDARMKLSYDLYYVKHRSLFLDVLILFSTVRVILFQEGAR